MLMKKMYVTFFALLLTLPFIQAQSIEFLNDDKAAKEINPPKPFILKGVYNITTLGVLGGSAQNQRKAPFSFQSLKLYAINSHVFAGVGAGVDFLEETYIPIVGDIRYYFRESYFSPFVFAQAGYSVSAEKKISQVVYNDYYYIWPYPTTIENIYPKGGFIFNPGFGVRHMFHEKFGLEISFSYHYQKLNYDSDSQSRLEVKYNRLNIRVGIIFQ